MESPQPPPCNNDEYVRTFARAIVYIDASLLNLFYVYALIRIVKKMKSPLLLFIIVMLMLGNVCVCTFTFANEKYQTLRCSSDI